MRISQSIRYVMINNIHYHLSGVLFLPHHSQLETRTFDAHEKEQTEEKDEEEEEEEEKEGEEEEEGAVIMMMY